MAERTKESKVTYQVHIGKLMELHAWQIQCYDWLCSLLQKLTSKMEAGAENYNFSWKNVSEEEKKGKSEWNFLIDLLLKIR